MSLNTLNKRRDAFFMDDGEYDDGDGADCDDGEYMDKEGLAYNEDDDDNNTKIKYEKSSARATKSTRRSTKGRQLKRWDVDEDQLLLLYCDYVCTQIGQPMPWNEIAAEFEPRDPASGRLAMTGEAIKQHLAKLRLHRETQGFHVPPKLDRSARRNAAAVQAGRRASVLQTPTATPKKSSGGSAAKPSTLLASVSKTKQKKAEKARKAAAGVAKPASAKRGRKSTLESLSGNDRKDRHPKAKGDAPVSVERNPLDSLVSIGGDVKSEVLSDDDDLPLSKKSKARNVGSSLMSDTLAIWEARDDVDSPVVASPPQYGDTSSFALPGIVPSQDSPVVASPPQYRSTTSFAIPGIVPSRSEDVDWSYSSSGGNSFGSDYPVGNEFFDSFGTVAPQPSSDFGGLPSFPFQTSGYAYAHPSQQLGMMPLSGQMPMLEAYNVFSQQTVTDPFSSFMDSSVTDSGQVPMDYNTFLNEQYEEDEFESPPNQFHDVFGATYSSN